MINKNKKISSLAMLSLALVLFNLIFITALDADYIFKQTEIVDIKRPCFNNGSYCTPTTACNITILSPTNDTALVLNKQMTNQIAYYNYTLGLNLDNGEYQAFMSCKDGSESGADTFYFEVNPTGLRSTDARTGAMSRAIYFLIIITILFFIGFLFISNVPAKFSMLIFAIIFLVASINIISASLRYEGASTEILSLFDFISAASFYFYWFAGGMLMIVWILTFFNTMNERFAKQKYDKFNGGIQ